MISPCLPEKKERSKLNITVNSHVYSILPYLTAFDSSDVTLKNQEGYEIHGACFLRTGYAGCAPDFKISKSGGEENLA